MVHRRFLFLTAGLLLAASTLSGCGGSSGQLASSDPLVVIGLTGGMCPDGLCERSYSIAQNGEVTSEEQIGRVPTRSLEAAIASSKLQTLKEDPGAFCQSYVDGQDLTVQVPAWGPTTYTICQLADGENDPLTLAAQATLQSIEAQQEESASPQAN